MGSLEKYKKKRDFKKTTEPAGKVKKRASKKTGIFVIQQHAARAMHYDVRLEIEGVLVSWAVPKGPSLNPSIKRLAVMTEDHPMEYAKFEGIIPEGQYGAGPVIIWDRGTYKNINEKDGKLVPMAQCLRDGHIEIFLNGNKLKGAFVFVRTDPKTVEKSRWLLIKMRDNYADARRNPISSQQESVKTGKTIKDWKQKIKKKKRK
jgi:DNA ligase D-like protein (predicted 3'-phosphoesterase)